MRSRARAQVARFTEPAMAHAEGLARTALRGHLAAADPLYAQVWGQTKAIAHWAERDESETERSRER